MALNVDACVSLARVVRGPGTERVDTTGGSDREGRPPRVRAQAPGAVRRMLARLQMSQTGAPR